MHGLCEASSRCVCACLDLCVSVCAYICVCFSCASCSASPLIPHSARPKHPCYIIIVSFTVVKPWDGSSNWKQVSGRQRSAKCLCAGVTFKYFSDSVFLLNCGQRSFEACAIAIKLPGCAIICWSGSFMLFPFLLYIYIYNITKVDSHIKHGPKFQLMRSVDVQLIAATHKLRLQTALLVC